MKELNYKGKKEAGGRIGHKGDGKKTLKEGGMKEGWRGGDLK